MNDSPHTPSFSSPVIPPARKRHFLLFMLFWAVLFTAAIGVQLWRMASLSQVWTGDGKNPDTYGFDLSRLQIDRSVLSASNRPRDARPVMDRVQPVTQEDIVRHNSRFGSYLRFLVPADLVVGIELEGEARAYPMRFLRVHEIVNDTLGSRPVAVTYCPLTDSVVVFDRRIGGREVLFGYSGLLHNSNSLLYDRPENGGDTASASLWSQLQARAISGPHAGQKLKVYPFFFGSWEEWLVRYPASTSMHTEAAFKDRYKNDELQQMHYYDKQEVWFPVSGLPRAGSRFNRMARMVLPAAALSHESRELPQGEVREIPRDPTTLQTPGPGHTAWATACWFAWVAMHPEMDAPADRP